MMIVMNQEAIGCNFNWQKWRYRVFRLVWNLSLLLNWNDKLSVNCLLTKKPHFNLACFQGNASVCGQYCLLYLLFKIWGFILKKIQNILHETETFAERDFVVNHFIIITFGNVLPHYNFMILSLDNKYLSVYNANYDSAF